MPCRTFFEWLTFHLTEPRTVARFGIKSCVWPDRKKGQQNNSLECFFLSSHLRSWQRFKHFNLGILKVCVNAKEIRLTLTVPLEPAYFCCLLSPRIMQLHQKQKIKKCWQQWSKGGEGGWGWLSDLVAKMSSGGA